MDYKLLVIILASAALVNNYVLNQFLGICPFLGVSKSSKSASGMGLAVAFVMVLATALTWPVQIYLLDPAGLGFLQTVTFILLIAALVQIMEMIMKKYLPALYKSLGVYLPLITTNCALFAVTINNIQKDYSFAEAMTNALGAGFGFLLAMMIFSGIREHTENVNPPESFKGIPITLISAAILSLAFFGFNGIAENLFG